MRVKVGRKSCSRRRSEPVPLEHGCYKSGLPLRALHALTLGAEDSSIYIYTCNLIARQRQKKTLILLGWTNTRIPIYLHAYIHTCIPPYIHSYIHTHIQNSTNPTNPTTRPNKLYPTLHNYSTNPNLLPNKYYTTLHTQTTHACAMEKKKYDYIEKW